VVVRYTIMHRLDPAQALATQQVQGLVKTCRVPARLALSLLQALSVPELDTLA
jgi:hypothetical protein